MTSITEQIAAKIATQFGYEHCELHHIGDYFEQYGLREEGPHYLELNTSEIATWRIIDCADNPKGIVLHHGELQLTFTVL